MKENKSTSACLTDRKNYTIAVTLNESALPRRFHKLLECKLAWKKVSFPDGTYYSPKGVRYQAYLRKNQN